MRTPMARYPSAVIFDLDGTLVDSAPDFLNALNRLFAELGRPAFALAEVRSMMGYGVRVLLEDALGRSGGVPAGQSLESLAERMIALFFRHHLEQSRLFPGVAPTLAHLREARVRLGLCTNKPQGATLETLERLGLDTYFDAVVGGGESAAMKPHPSHVLAVVERLGANREATVLVGDTEIDAAAARAAGLPVVLVRYGYSRVPVDSLEADAVIDEFSGLLAALEGFT